jgi:hypothetical protein
MAGVLANVSEFQSSHARAGGHPVLPGSLASRLCGNDGVRDGLTQIETLLRKMPGCPSESVPLAPPVFCSTRMLNEDSRWQSQWHTQFQSFVVV